MTRWQDLMALSVTQTQQAKEAVQSALADRQRREAQKRKEIEEKERRERELENKLRLKRLEERQREQERLERQEKERQAKEREIQRREEQQRDALRYGPKKAKDGQGYPLSGAAKRRHSSSSDDEAGSSNALTREEKRQRRLDAELRGGRSALRRSTVGGSGYSKAGRRLPGGAVDITTTTGSSSHSSPGKSQSIRERIAAEPAMLIKLNTNKRDTRTIDEIVQDRAKARQGKVLDGESAREFNDWFGKAKKDPPKKASVPATPTSTSRANTPVVGGPSIGSHSKVASGSASPSPFSSAPSKLQSISKSSTPSAQPGTSTSAKAAATKPLAPRAANAKTTTSRPLPPSSKPISSAPVSKPMPKKRRRSLSPSVSPPPTKRRPASGGTSNDISSEIWKLFGKDRSSYIQRDVYSDDEDMEAGAFDVEKEELRSMRFAKKEDEEAMEQERRHEEEKRRRRKEKERRERGHY